jgi:hypothetical protein
MFLDFALLAEQQGESLDQIEFNVMRATDYVKEANVDTHTAIEYQRSIRKKAMFDHHHCGYRCCYSHYSADPTFIMNWWHMLKGSK